MRDRANVCVGVPTNTIDIIVLCGRHVDLLPLEVVYRHIFTIRPPSLPLGEQQWKQWMEKKCCLYLSKDKHRISRVYIAGFNLDNDRYRGSDEVVDVHSNVRYSLLYSEDITLGPMSIYIKLRSTCGHNSGVVIEWRCGTFRCFSPPTPGDFSCVVLCVRFGRLEQHIRIGPNTETPWLLLVRRSTRVKQWHLRVRSHWIEWNHCDWSYEHREI